MKKPLVSVIMNCFNGEKYLREAIESVVAQSYPNWELIIWDNQSDDGTAEIVQSYSDERIKYFLAERHTALGEARNLAIQKSKGDIIGFLDSDDVWFSEKLEKQVPLFRDTGVGIVICDTYFFNKTGILKQFYKKKKPPTGQVFRELLSNYFISLETALIRRKALDSLTGWFDTRFEVIEEYDLFVRLGYGWELAYVDEVMAKWRVHASSWTWTRGELFPQERWMMIKKLEKDIPDFSTVYFDEIRKVKRYIAFEKMQISWEKGEKRNARDQIKPYIFNSLKYFFLYLITPLPYRLFKYLQNIRGTVTSPV